MLSITGINRYSIPTLAALPCVGTRYSPLKGDTDTSGRVVPGKEMIVIFTCERTPEEHVGMTTCLNCGETFYPECLDPQARTKLVDANDNAPTSTGEKDRAKS